VDFAILLEKRLRVPLRRGLNYGGKGFKALEENRDMNARPLVRQHLLALKMKRWAQIGRSPSTYSNHRSAQARRNFARLYAKYPEIAKRLGLHAISPYPPL